MSPRKEVLLHSGLIQILQTFGSIQVSMIAHLIPPPILQLEALHGLYLLQSNVRLQGANELLNNMYDIFWQ